MTKEKSEWKKSEKRKMCVRGGVLMLKKNKREEEEIRGKEKDGKKKEKGEGREVKKICIKITNNEI